MEPPPGFINLKAAYTSAPESFVNLIGIVVDLMSPNVTSRNQYMFTFKLLDPSLRDYGFGNQRLTVRFFMRDVESLPRVRQHGDVVLLRNIKITSFNQQPIALSNYQTSVLVFSAASIPDPAFELAYQGSKRIECHGVPLDVQKLTLAEQRYVIYLKQDLSPELQSLPGDGAPVWSTQQLPRAPAATRAADSAMKRSADALPQNDAKRTKPSTFGNKYSTIKDMRHNKFADICVQVVRKFPTNYGYCELYVTDYTENKGMFYYAPPEEEAEKERDGDVYGYAEPSKRAWPGPYGWLVLKVDLKDPHASYANREIEEGEFVLLRNVRTKLVHRLEGNMWPDHLNPEKVLISKIKGRDVPEIIEIQERKDKYWEIRNAKAPPGAPTEPKAEREKKMSRTERKRLKKESKLSNQIAKANNVKAAAEKVSAKDRINPHIRCSNEDAPMSTIKEILDLNDSRHMNTMPDGTTYAMPFINAKYRACVRVVDFDPLLLEEFSVPEVPDDDDKSEHSIDNMDWDSSPKHRWYFSLQLEDASKQKATNGSENKIWVSVGHEDAQYLLGNGIEDPVDLRSNSNFLRQLREKLCILWGNLEEEKKDDEAVSNLPFECCLMEYGVELDDDDKEKDSTCLGFKRMYRMFGVTIL